MSRHKADLVPLSGLLALVALVVGSHVVVFKEISPIDELSHIDTAFKASRFEIVRVGDAVGEEAMREEACRGFARPDDPIPPCDAPTLLPDFFQDSGFNTAATKFPVYHFLTGLPARSLVAATPIDSFVTAARLMGAVWLGGAVVLAWFTLALLGVNRWARLVCLALLITTPVVVQMSSIVNPDALLPLTGTAVIYGTLLWERRRLPGPFLLGLIALTLLIENTNLVAVALAGLYLAFRAALHVSRIGQVARASGWSAARTIIPKRLLLMGAVVSVGAAAVGLSYSQLHEAVIGESAHPHSLTSDEAYVAAFRPSEIENGPVPAEKIVGELDALVTPVKRPYIPPFLAGIGTSTILKFVEWLLIAGVAIVVMRSGGDSRLAVLGFATLAVLLATGPALAWDNARRDVYYAIPPRFGLPVLPLMFGYVGAALRQRNVLLGVGALAVWSVANLMYKLGAA